MPGLLYSGSGPYCYSHSLAMMLGNAAPEPGTIEVLTGAPFGMALVAGELPFFDPYGWDPELGLDTALSLLGWRCRCDSGGEEAEALRRLRRATAEGPVLVGPVEMGLLRHQPGMSGPIGADHYVVVLEVGDERVVMHDPQGYPFAALPVPLLLRAWRAETIPYGSPFTMRHGFARDREVAVDEALRAAVPNAVAFLSNRADLPVPEGTLGTAAAARVLADMLSAGPGPELKDHLMHFAIRVGARRLSDAAAALYGLGFDAAADVAATQARLVGALQYDIVTDDHAAAAATLRRLAPTYERLGALLSRADGSTALSAG
ncbi:hypothetical protein [Nocardia wallacei]|uniref:hypothetical protein n=1 Tax=Nocardia wallacei TaxID=480035 RepID=UPI002455C4E2|nr:hypothetical protein [Nocardia wallacei]